MDIIKGRHTPAEQKQAGTRRGLHQKIAARRGAH